MKLKFLFVSLVAGLAALTASAQEAAQKPVRKTTFERQAASDHWFITLQGGVGSQFLYSNEVKPFLDRIQQSYSLSIGHYLTPAFATRLNFVGAQAHTFYRDNKEVVKNYETSFVGAHFDFMLDLVNYCTPYKSNRVFHVIPFVGFGYNMKFNKAFEDLHHTPAIDAGLQLQFRLAKRADLVIEGKAIYNNFNFYAGDKPVQWNPNAYNGFYAALTGGLNFRLGGTEWTEIVPMDYELIENLNNQISALRSENAELSKRPVSCPECPEVKAETQVVSVLADKAILFDFDSSRIARNQEVTLFSISEFVKSQNTPIVVIGYADTTGNSDYNLKLSERRAKAVADALVEKYGVPADMITTQWEGDQTQIFDTPAWNRVVIVRSK